MIVAYAIWARMTDRIKMALIMAATLLLAVGAYIFYSPFQTCMRAERGTGIPEMDAASMCKGSGY